MSVAVEGNVTLFVRFAQDLAAFSTPESESPGQLGQNFINLAEPCCCECPQAMTLGRNNTKRTYNCFTRPEVENLLEHQQEAK